MMLLEQTISRNTVMTSDDPVSFSEAAAVEASRRGDARAFNGLVRQWERPIYGLSRRMLKNADDAAEATQEIFLSAFRNMHRFKAGARFSTWLYRIAVNHCISRLRRRARHFHFSLSGPPEETGLGNLPPQLRAPALHEEELLAEESRREVRAALGRLSPEQRAVVELKFYQELTFEEIAPIVGCPVGTVKSRFYAGLASLKERLGGH